MRAITILIIILTVFISCGKSNKVEVSESVGFVKDTVVQGIELVYVPYGEYAAGLECEPKTITYNYWIGRFEITNRQYHDFLTLAMADSFLQVENSKIRYYYQGDSLISAGDYHIKVFDNRLSFDSGIVKLDTAFEDHPVIGVTWYGAKAFCDYFGFDLPTVAEWEKAARGLNCSRFPWGNEVNGSYANYDESGDPFEPGTTPVGFFNGSTQNGFQTSNGQSYYGCYDMAGNAWEWTNEPWSSETPYHKGKGGGFNYHTAAHLQVYYHSSFGPNIRPPLDMCNVSDGFRVVSK